MQSFVQVVPGVSGQGWRLCGKGEAGGGGGGGGGGRGGRRAQQSHISSPRRGWSSTYSLFEKRSNIVWGKAFESKVFKMPRVDLGGSSVTVGLSHIGSLGFYSRRGDFIK